MVDAYEILPHKEIEEIKKEIVKLKKRYGPDEDEVQELFEKMKRLESSIDDLLVIFKNAFEMIKESKISIGERDKKITEILEESKKMGEAILALGQTINNLNSEINNIKLAINEINKKVDQLLQSRPTMQNKQVPTPSYQLQPQPTTGQAMKPSYGMINPIVPPPAPTE